VVMYSGPMAWASKLQREVALTTTEAEYNALLESPREVISLMHLMKGDQGEVTLGGHNRDAPCGPALQGVRGQFRGIGDEPTKHLRVYDIVSTNETHSHGRDQPASQAAPASYVAEGTAIT
jgi:hypothetical protein